MSRPEAIGSASSPLTRVGRPHPPGGRIRFLLQHLDEAAGTVRSHLDISTDNRDAECGRHLEAGAVLVAEHGHWTVMRDPAGMTYCLTDRDPVTGKLPALA